MKSDRGWLDTLQTEARSALPKGSGTVRDLLRTNLSTLLRRQLHNRVMQSLFSRSVALCLATSFALASLAAGLEPIVAISGSAPKTVKHGGKLVASVKFAVPSGFHIYSPSFKGIGIPVTFELKGAPAGFKVLTAKAPAGGELKGNLTMQVPIAVPSSAKGKSAFSLVVHYQQCNDRICLPPTTATVNLNTVVK